MIKASAKKIAMVTGGLRGIGYGVVKKLIEDGYAVSAMGRSPEESIKDAVQPLTESGGEIIYTSGDISKKTDCEKYLENTLNFGGRLDVLVNNAGVAPDKRTDLLDMSEESFDRVLGINLKGTMMLTQLAAKQMISQPGGEDGITALRKGVIINISSISAYTSSTNRGEYCISKAGMSMLTMLFADRLAGEGVYVYEIRPGIIQTDMTSGVKEKYDGFISSGGLPIKRWGLPEDIGNGVSALLTDKFLYSTGEIINIDGGFHIRRL